MPIWAEARCGSATPALPQTNIVSPEQSNASGPAAAQTYGLPSSRAAQASAIAARPLAGAGGGAAGGGGGPPAGAAAAAGAGGPGGGGGAAPRRPARRGARRRTRRRRR